MEMFGGSVVYFVMAEVVAAMLFDATASTLF